MKISVIIPFYNEERTLNELLEMVIATGKAYEIICIDDGSTDSSPEIISHIKNNHEIIKLIKLDRNYGKGYAVRKGLDEVRGDIVLVQDADLEYSPVHYPELLKPFEDKSVMVVYGSRNIYKNPKSSNAFYFGGVILSKITNLLYGSSISDESTGFKLFRTNLIKDINLTCEGFEFCPEITAKILKKKIKITEVPVNYNPRSAKEGKKIKWRDGVTAIWTLVKFRFIN